MSDAEFHPYGLPPSRNLMTHCGACDWAVGSTHQHAEVEMAPLITRQEMETLPVEASARFIAINEICYARHLDEMQNAESTHAARESQLLYMNTMVAAAKHLKIEGISDITVPKLINFNDTGYADFMSVLTHYSVQIMLRAADSNMRTSITLRGSTLDRLRTLTSHLRNEVRKLALPAARIDRLVQRIGDFERDLDGPRLSFVRVAEVAVSIAGAIGKLGGGALVVKKLVSEIEEAVGEAKHEQDSDAASRLPEEQTPPPLSPPRSIDPAPRADDEIPF